MTNPFLLEKLGAHRWFAQPLFKLLLAATGLMASLQGQTPGPTVTPYQIPSGQAAISNIVSAPDGRLWFITANGDTTSYNAVAVATNGTITSYSLGGAYTSYPIGNSICVGPDGALWFTAGRGSSAVLGRVTTAGVVTTVAIPGGVAFQNGSGAITAGPDNNLWFTDASSALLYQYNPTTNTFQQFLLSSTGFGVTAGPGGNIWVTEYNITSSESGPNWSGSVASVTTAGVVNFEHPFPQQNLTFSQISESPLDTFTTGPDGNLWFTEYNGTQIGTVTASGVVTTVYQGFANGITNGNDGNLWFTQPYEDVQNLSPALVKLTTSGQTTVNSLDFSQFDSPYGVTVGTDGALWFNDSYDATVGRAALPLAISTSSLPAGNYGAAYPSTTLQATGGIQPYTWSWTAATSSTLPPGLTLTAAGVISGTPTATGTFNVVVQAADSESPAVTATKALSITISAGSASGVTASSGSGQTAPINAAFTSPLVAKVADAGGDPVPNVSVTFTAPASGASGNFTGGTGNIATVPTNAQGLATAPTFTANAIAGSIAVNASAPGVSAAATFSLTSVAGTASTVTATSGSGQSASVNTAFASPLVATVKDASGNPVANASVTFTAPVSGASGTFTGGTNTFTMPTNAQGVATSPTFSANAIAGAFSVTVSVAGTSASATFSLTNVAGGAATISATSGSGQSAPINTAFATPLVASVKDAAGNPVAGASVTFAAPGSGASGSFAGAATVTTNAQGTATSPTFTANAIAGAFSVTASTAGATATFSLTNTPGAAATITASAGSGQSAAINAAFATALAATVKDAGGNAVANATVTFTAAGSGASGSFAGAATATVPTNGQGVATAPAFTANATAGNYSVSATTTGVGTPTTFSLTNTVGTATGITATSGSGQSAPINSSFASPLMATLKDAGGNPVANANVTFTAPGSGAGGSFAGGATTAIATTNGQGVATSPTFTANATTGSYTVNATAAGVANPALFSLTNTVGTAANIAATSGSGQTAAINSQFANVLLATVTDSGGNPVPNASVTFAAPSSGIGGSFGGGALTMVATTNSSGVATSSTFTANANVGTYNVTATVAGVTPASFTLTNKSGTPASINVNSGSGQSATVNTPFGSTLVAIVKDAGGNLVPNVTVTFTAPASGASGSFAGGALSATATTTSSGVATSPVFTANTIAGGPYNVTATVPGVGGSASFGLSNTPGTPATITATSGSGQSAKVSTNFVSPLAVTVKDANGNVVSNVSVTFFMPGTGASATFGGSGISASTQTNSAGIATSPAFTANGIAGTFFATVNGPNNISVQFSLTNTAGAPGSITVTSGSGQSAQQGKPFNPLVATVTDASNNPVANAVVTFSAPGSGASGTFAGTGATVTATTNGAGIATSPTFTANTTAGSYSVFASVSGAQSAVAFNLTNNAGAPASITASSGSVQTARINSSFSNPFVVTVEDSGGNPLDNVTVTFAGPSSGAGGTFAGGGVIATASTKTGVATSPIFSANGTSGSYSITASVVGLTSQAIFTLNNVAVLTITTTTLPAGTAGVAYSQMLTGVAGVTPYKWTVSGLLPPGLTLKAGVITGTPTAPGTYPFAVSLTDSSMPSPLTAGPVPLSITINPPANAPIVPKFTIMGLPATPVAGASVTTATVQLDQVSSAAYTGTLSLTFTPNAAVSGLPEGFTGDAGFVSATAKTTTVTVTIPAGSTSVPIPTFDLGTVAGDVTVTLVVGNTASAPAVVTVPVEAPIIEVSSVQIVDVTATGFSVELVATSTTRDLKNATFTFNAAAGATISGTASFPVDVSSILSTWYGSTTSYQYGGAFSLTIPFTLSGSASAIGSVSVTLSNSAGISTPVSGTQ